MFKKDPQIIQPMLGFNDTCPYCPLRFLKLCDGVAELDSYSMGGKSVIGCLDARRIGLFFDDIFEKVEPVPKSFNQEALSLPTTVFALTDGRIDLTDFDEDPLFGLSMSVFIKDSGEIAFKNKADLTKRLRLPPRARISLIGTSSENKHQALWRVSERLGIWKRIAEFGFEWVTSTSFPVWDENPRSDQVLFQQRNYRVSDILANLGVPVIPFVFPYNDTDYRSFGSWIRKRESIGTVAVLATYYKHDAHFALLLGNMQKIVEAADKPLYFLIVGASAESKLSLASAAFPNCSFVTSSSYARALAGQDLKRVRRVGARKSDVWTSNYRAHNQLVQDVRKNL